MTRTLYLFRHGETDALVAGARYGDAADDKLTERGKDQAAALATTLADMPIDIFYSSPYERSYNTAKTVATKHPDAGIITDDRLREGVFFFWDTDDTDAANKCTDTFARVSAAMNEILATGFEHIAIASHGGITRAILKYLGHEVGSIHPCECFILEHRNNTWTIVSNSRHD